MRRSVPFLCVLLFLSPLAAFSNYSAHIVDIFGRDPSGRGVTLVDWDGFIANPALSYWIWGPQSGADEKIWPIEVTVQANSTRVYFNVPSKVTEEGASKSFTLKDAKTPHNLFISVWPDRDGRSDSATLTITTKDKTGAVSSRAIEIHIRDEDKEAGVQTDLLTVHGEDPYPFLKTARDPEVVAPVPFYSRRKGLDLRGPFNITLDVRYDKSGVFQKDPHALASAQQAANDLAHFFSPLDVDPVGIGEEETDLMDFSIDRNGKSAGVVGGYARSPSEKYKLEGVIKNAVPFKDFLFYLIGTNLASETPASSISSRYAFQRKGNASYSFRRSGSVLVPFGAPGVNTQYEDMSWFKAKYNSRDKKDLYSLMHHEFVHSLGINSANATAARWVGQRRVDGNLLEYYFGGRPQIEDSYHLVKGKITNADGSKRDDPEIDPLSGKPGFGGISGWMFHERWILTKLDLLVFKALGFPLRAGTSALKPLQIQTASLAEGEKGKPYQGAVTASGGVAVYDWTVAEGHLPTGLTLDRFDGSIVGTPQIPGVYQFVVRVRDYETVTSDEDFKAFQVVIL